jgi:hypothetical protein
MAMTEHHLATVTATDDPEKRGRIRVTCVGLLGDDESDLPMWIEPVLDWGWFAIPDPGEQVEIEINVASDEDESYNQASIDQLDAKWRGGRYFGGSENTQPVLINEFFKASYGKRRGFMTPWGHVMLFDDTEGSASIAIHMALEKDARTDAAKLHSIVVDKDGIKQTIADKHSFHFKADGSVNVEIDEGAGLTINGKDADTVATFGDGAVHAAIAEALEAFYTNNLKPYIENALVQTSMGPSSTILVGSGPAPTWDAAIKSSKLAFPDNG